MEEFILEQKKHNKRQFIMMMVCMICCIGMFVAVAFTAFTIIPVVGDISVAVNDLATSLEANLETLQTISDSIVNENLVGGLADGVERISSIDIDTLNSAIKDLQDVVAPLAKTVNFFR